MIKTKIIFKNTVLFFVMILFAGINFACHAQDKSKVETQKPINYQTKISTGAEQSDKYLPLLKDRKVGILTNQTGIIEFWESGKETNHSNNGCGSEVDVAMELVNSSVVDLLLEKNIDIQKI